MTTQKTPITFLVDFFHANKLICALLVASMLVLLAGIIMINITNSTAPQTASPVEAPTAAEQLAAYQSLANNAAAELETSRAAAAGAKVTIGDMKPEFYAQQVAALNGEKAEVGSEGWCALMMIKDADDWTKSEHQLFAQHCL
jgi:hypothetical protein